MSLGEQIKQARLGKNLTQEGLAKQIGVPQNNVHRWESGKFLPSIDNLKKLSKVLETPIDQLIFTPEERQAQDLNDPEISESLEILQNLNPEEKEAVVKLLRGLRKS